MSDSLVSQISTALVSETSFEGLVRQLLTLLELATDLESAYLTRIDLDANNQSVLFAHNSKRMKIPEGLSVPWGDTLCKRALDEGRVYTEDVPRRWGDSDSARALGIVTYVSTPVRLDDGSLYGTLCAASTEQKPLTQRGEEVLRLFGKLISQHIEKEKLVQDLQQANEALRTHSYVDPLTKLPNRRAVMENLPRQFALARRNRQFVIVAFIDLDGFKQINDQFGHSAGDAFLTEVGHRLQAGIRAGDLLGRWGGDEFIVSGLCLGESAEVVAAMRERLHNALQRRYRLPRVALDYLGASVGIIVVDAGASTPEQALQDADAAMYLDKKERKAGKALPFHIAPSQPSPVSGN
ncbi:sensor domain-containing diguanylate cyclase [Dongia rigui]|uniref:diguanylate cyclase n=1 Tax=Dongia rigui TaxID=940149 RepID=A0ABU5E2B4_9PROT|nr:sensor domain-containing diguanylate cyclase [Dongia rigui]MDY0873696.1 sensor domain-containing diguanylate cyclase [Dongia rigui]